MHRGAVHRVLARQGAHEAVEFYSVLDWVYRAAALPSFRGPSPQMSIGARRAPVLARRRASIGPSSGATRPIWVEPCQSDLDAPRPRSAA